MSLKSKNRAASSFDRSIYHYRFIPLIFYFSFPLLNLSNFGTGYRLYRHTLLTTSYMFRNLFNRGLFRSWVKVLQISQVLPFGDAKDGWEQLL